MRRLILASVAITALSSAAFATGAPPATQNIYFQPPFTPLAVGSRMGSTTNTVGTSDTTFTLPVNAPQVVISNTGNANVAYCNVVQVAATAQDQPIQAGSWVEFTVPVGTTILHCIAPGGATSITGLGGSGYMTGSGGGSGGSGGTIGTVSQGTAALPAAPWYVAPGTGAVFNVAGTFFQATQPISAASLPLPAGAALDASLTTINTTLGTLSKNSGSSITANAGTNLNTSALALDATVTTLNSTTNSLFKAGQNIGNTGFNITGTLPAFASTPAFTLSGTPSITGTVVATGPSAAALATAALQPTINGDGGAQVHVMNSITSSLSVGTAAYTPAYVTVNAATATLLAAARTGVPGTGRHDITIINNAANNLWFGNSSVTNTGSGSYFYILPNASITIPTTAAVYGILDVGSASSPISVLETF